MGLNQEVVCDSEVEANRFERAVCPEIAGRASAATTGSAA